MVSAANGLAVDIDYRFGRSVSKGPIKGRSLPYIALGLGDNGQLKVWWLKLLEQWLEANPVNGGRGRGFSGGFGGVVGRAFE